MADLAVAAQAAEQIETVAAWWTENRPAAPHLFGTELRRTFDLIASQPDIGAPATDIALKDVRRILIGRSRYFVYYRHVAGTVVVLAVWHASRGEGPPL